MQYVINALKLHLFQHIFALTYIGDAKNAYKSKNVLS